MTRRSTDRKCGITPRGVQTQPIFAMQAVAAREKVSTKYVLNEAGGACYNDFINITIGTILVYALKRRPGGPVTTIGVATKIVRVAIG